MHKLLTLAYLAKVLNCSIEDVALAAAQDPPVRHMALADKTRIYDREAADIIRYRLEKMEGNDNE